MPRDFFGCKISRQLPPAFACESLEQRIVLSAEFVSAGLADIFANVQAFSLVGSVDDAGVVVADRLNAANPGPPPVATPTLEQLKTLAGGGFDTQRTEGSPLTLDVGTRFDLSEGFGAGWLSSFTGTDLSEFQVIVERPEEGAISLASIGGFWRMHTIEYSLDAQNQLTSIGVFEGTTTISGSTFFTQLIGSPGEAPKIQNRVIVGNDNRGGFALNDDAELFSNADGSILIYRDLDHEAHNSLDGNDGGIGILVRSDINPTVEEVAGLYRFGGVAFQEIAQAFFGGVPSADWVIELRTDSTWRAFDLSDSERQIANEVVAEGVWNLTGGILSLTSGEADQGGAVLNFEVASDGNTLIVVGVESAGSLVKAFGIAERIPQNAGAPGDEIPDDGDGGGGGGGGGGGAGGGGAMQASASFEIGGGGGGGGEDPVTALIGVGGRNINDEPLAFDLRGETWFVADLISIATGTDQQTADTLDFEVWIDPADGQLFAAASTVDGLYVYRRNDDKSWEVRNLTSELTGAEGIAGDLTVFFTINDEVYISGLAADGALVYYENIQDQLLSGNERWEFENVLDAQLTPKGVDMPAIVSPLTSYVTSWNGLNVIGLDAAGDIWAVWSGDGGNIWWANNLSEITGALPISGGLTAYLTTWDGINIAGIDSDGSLVVSWWVPQFGADWVVSNLSDVAEGPALDPGSITSYVAPWGGLNVAGLDASGEVVIYWWSPAREAEGLTWTTSNLTASLPAETKRPETNLSSAVATGGTNGVSLNVFGDAANGDVIRLFFEVDTDVWTLQNVTADARAD